MYHQQPYDGQHGGHSGFSCRPIVLDDYNSDLNFVVEADGLTGSSLHRDGFEYLWAGARATHGVSSGKACFEVVVGEKLPVNMSENERTPHVVRMGWSTDFSSLQVGEDVMSYGYGGTGKCSENNRFFDYGEPYSTNDVIGCYIDLDTRIIFFTKNGHYLAEAFRLAPETHNTVLYPHVTVKNMKVHVNFGLKSPCFLPVDGYTMIQQIPPNLLTRATGSPDTRKDCQVIMMVGVPACGKTYWAEKYAQENKQKKFHIIGTNAIMDRMKVMGLTRQRNYHGRWDALIKQATDILNKLLKIAEKKNRNYILDQTNVYPSARRRKISCFHGFHCIAAVLVNRDEVLQYRTDKREKEEGKLVPKKAVMEMKANFTLPTRGDIFDEVWFIEEDEESSKRLIEQYNKEGKEYLEREQQRNEQPASISGHHPHNTNSENPQFNQRGHAHVPPAEAHGFSAHNPRVYHSHGSQPYGSHIPREGLIPPDRRPQASYPSSQGDYAHGPPRHNPERGGYSMQGTMHSRYTPYNAPRRCDTYPSHLYHQNHGSSQHYYDNREPYMQQYRLDYPSPYGYNRPEVNVDCYPVEETRPSGCSMFETLNPAGNTRIPVENEYSERPPSSEQYHHCVASRGHQGYSAQNQYNSWQRF